MTPDQSLITTNAAITTILIRIKFTTTVVERGLNLNLVIQSGGDILLEQHKSNLSNLGKKTYVRDIVTDGPYKKMMDIYWE